MMTPTDPSDFMPLAGGCPCGAVRFRMETAPIITHCCHCRSCQKFSGSAFKINAMIETARLTVLAGAAVAHIDADGQKECRCGACGSALWAFHPRFGETLAFVGVGLFEEGERLAPEAHYFIRSKHPWIVLPEGVPAFEQLGDPGKSGMRERIAAAMAAPPAKP
jgi:hypothetical protein